MPVDGQQPPSLDQKMVGHGLKEEVGQTVVVVVNELEFGGIEAVDVVLNDQFDVGQRRRPSLQRWTLAQDRKEDFPARIDAAIIVADVVEFVAFVVVDFRWPHWMNGSKGI